MSEILPKQLYLGSYQMVKSETTYLVEELQITDFINVAQEVSYSNRVLSYFKEKGVFWYKFQVSDDEKSLRNQFQAVIELMNLLISNGSCLYLHCHLGVSRAPSLVIAYLVKYQDFTIEKAIEHVSEQRPQISPNPEFLQQLLIDKIK